MTDVVSATSSVITTAEELQRLKKQKQQCIETAKQTAITHDRTWNKIINQLAQIMEQEYILLGTEFLTNNISEEIARIFREGSIKIWAYVHEYLPTKYKNINLDTSTSRALPPQLPEQTFISIMHDVVTNIPNIPREFIAEIHSASKQLEQHCEKRANKENIALLPDDRASYTDQENANREDSRPSVTIDKPQPHGSLTFDALGKVIERLTKVQERVFEFPPEVLDRDQEIADSFHTWSIWMEPSLDLKYSKSWLDWFKAEKYRDIYGKHAAGVLSFSVTNLCANCSDEKTKEWVRMEPAYARMHSSFKCYTCNQVMHSLCPNCQNPMKELKQDAVVGWQCPECDGIVPMHRNLTREQIGDKSSIIIDTAIEMLKHIPALMGFCTWYSDWIDPRVAGRKIRLSGDLSDKA